VAAHGCVDGGGALVAVAGLDFGVVVNEKLYDFLMT